VSGDLYRFQVSHQVIRGVCRKLELGHFGMTGHQSLNERFFKPFDGIKLRELTERDGVRVAAPVTGADCVTLGTVAVCDGIAARYGAIGG
jgi:hypothetical protein